jgi:hypothetical protein
VENQLQAVQLGASLYDRAQTQKRMMEQFQLQAAQQVMQREHYDIQNKTASYNLGRSMDDQAKFAVDLPKIQQWQSAYVQWNAAGNPTAPFPAPPSDLQSATGLKMLGDMSGPVIQSLPMAQNRFYAEQAYRGQMNNLNSSIEILADNGQFDIINQYNSGINPETQRINPEAFKALQIAASPFKQEATALTNMPADLKAEFMRLPKDGKTISEKINIAYLNLEEKKLAAPTAVTRNTEYTIKAKIDAAAEAGAPLSETQIKKLRNDLSQAGGKVRPLDLSVSKKINNDFAVIEAVDSVLDKISDFEKANKVDFTGYLGIIPTTIYGIESRIVKETDPKKLEALGFISNFYGLLNEVGTTTSGLTVTVQEGKRIEGEIGSKLDKNSLVKLKAFRNRKEEGLRSVIQKNMDRDLPSFAEEWVQTPFGTSSASLYKFPTRAGQQQPQSVEPQGAGGSFEQPTSPPSEQGTNAAGGGYQMGRFEVKVKK